MESLGSGNSSEACHDCRFRQPQGAWRPFSQISSGGWEKIEEKVKERSMSTGSYPYDHEGKCLIQPRTRVRYSRIMVQVVDGGGSATT